MSALEYTTLDTPAGRVRGIRHATVSRFRKVPYAQAPVGGLRFAPPRPLESAARGVDATAAGPMPPQLPSRLAKVMGEYPTPQDEDCLHLDIWVPHERATRAPVLVFIHGGAFMTGGGSQACYDGSVLAERTGMIVVNVSYRLGVLGFLAIPGVAPANLGLRDQMLALAWVRRCIGAFGGDTANVTVAGQSAGAFTIAAMRARADGPTLFDRAILMSAPLGVPLAAPEPMRESATVFARALGSDGPLTPEQAAQLSIPQLLQAQVAVLRATPPAGPGVITPPFMPLLDGEIIAAPLMDESSMRASTWCDAVVGFTREEAAGFYVDDAAMQALPAQTVEQAFVTHYGDSGAARYARAVASRAPGTPLAALTDLRSDVDFIADSLAYARATAQGARAPFVYQFDWQSPRADIGACHCMDLPFLFGNLSTWQAAPMLAGADPREFTHLSQVFQDMLAAFARTGEATGPGLPTWPRHGDDHATLHIDRQIRAYGACLDAALPRS